MTMVCWDIDANEPADCEEHKECRQGRAMTELWENACALWFWRHLAVEFEIYGREYDAAAAAAYMEEYEHGVPMGLQLSDGRTIKVEDWEAFKDAEERLRNNKETVRAVPPRKTRMILNPFDGTPKRVDADEPMWLGIRPEVIANQWKKGESGQGG